MADLELNGPIDPAADIAPQDTLRLKRALSRLGFYREPEGGLTDIPDTAMFEALEAFQDAADLDERGSMLPNGPTAQRIGESLKDIGSKTEPGTPGEPKPNRPGKAPDKDGDCPPYHQKLAQSICVPGTSLCWNRFKCVNVGVVPWHGTRG